MVLGRRMSVQQQWERQKFEGGEMVTPFHYIEGTLGVYEINRVELLRDVFAWS